MYSYVMLILCTFDIIWWEWQYFSIVFLLPKKKVTMYSIIMKKTYHSTHNLWTLYSTPQNYESHPKQGSLKNCHIQEKPKKIWQLNICMVCVCVYVHVCVNVYVQNHRNSGIPTIILSFILLGDWVHTCVLWQCNSITVISKNEGNSSKHMNLLVLSEFTHGFPFLQWVKNYLMI